MWDVSAGERHTLLLADGDCIQPIIYYSGQQVKEGEEEGGNEKELHQQGGGEEEEEEQAGGYTQQPVLLPFCMNVRSLMLQVLAFSSALSCWYECWYECECAFLVFFPAWLCEQCVRGWAAVRGTL